VLKPFGNALWRRRRRSSGDNHVVAYAPVHRRRDAVLGAELEAVEHPQNLIDVTSDRRAICEGQLHLFVRTDDEHCAYRRSLDRVRVDHPAEPMLVADERVVETLALGLGDIGGPFAMGVDRVHTHADELGVAGTEPVATASELSELGRAHRGEVSGMGEKHTPTISEITVKTKVLSVVST